MDEQRRCPHCGTKIEHLVEPQGRIEIELTLTDAQCERIRKWAVGHLAAIAEDLANGEELGDPVDDMGFRPFLTDWDMEFEQLVLDQLRAEFKILAMKVRR